MNHRTRSTNGARLAWFVLVSLALAGCSSWRLETLPAPAREPIRVLDVVELRLGSGRTIELAQVIVTSDSVIGTTTAADWTRRGLPVERLAFARRDVIETRVKSPNPKKTFFIALAVSILGAAALLASLPIGVAD